jgi:hypothetical protein
MRPHQFSDDHHDVFFVDTHASHQMLPMNNLEKAAWSTLSISIQSTVRASLQAANLTTVELGTVRPVSIREVLVWSSPSHLRRM